jgi:hypothetical protein
MAFKEVSNTSSFKKATEMAIGEVLTGYVIGLVESEKYGGQNLLMQDPETGHQYTFGVAGSLKYDIADGRLVVGPLTQITRITDGFSKKANKPMSKFKVLQDPEQTLGGANELDAALGTAETTSNVAAMRTSTNAAIEKNATNAIKNRAKEIAAANKR